jgi:hypothetical protein
MDQRRMGPSRSNGSRHKPSKRQEEAAMEAPFKAVFKAIEAPVEEAAVEAPFKAILKAIETPPVEAMMVVEPGMEVAAEARVLHSVTTTASHGSGLNLAGSPEHDQEGEGANTKDQ